MKGQQADGDLRRRLHIASRATKHAREGSRVNQPQGEARQTG